MPCLLFVLTSANFVYFNFLTQSKYRNNNNNKYYLKICIMLQQHFLEQYTLLSLICISGRDVKSGNRINIVLLTPLKKIKSKVIRILQVQISNLGKE